MQVDQNSVFIQAAVKVAVVIGAGGNALSFPACTDVCRARVQRPRRPAAGWSTFFPVVRSVRVSVASVTSTIDRVQKLFAYYCDLSLLWLVHEQAYFETGQLRTLTIRVERQPRAANAAADDFSS